MHMHAWHRDLDGAKMVYVHTCLAFTLPHAAAAPGGDLKAGKVSAPHPPPGTQRERRKKRKRQKSGSETMPVFYLALSRPRGARVPRPCPRRPLPSALPCPAMPCHAMPCPVLPMQPRGRRAGWLVGGLAYATLFGFLFRPSGMCCTGLYGCGRTVMRSKTNHDDKNTRLFSSRRMPQANP